MNVKEVSKEQIEDMRALVGSGDIVLDNTRRMFKTLRNRGTDLSDEDLLRAHAATDDDDNEELCNNIEAVEAMKAEAPASA